MLTSANSVGVVNQASKFIVTDRQFETEAPWHLRVIEQSNHKARRSDLCRYKQNSFDCHLKSGERHVMAELVLTLFTKCVAIVRAPNLCALLTHCQLLFVLFLVSR
jgi:predicted DNA-binding transcriptional regulator YafY